MFEEIMETPLGILIIHATEQHIAEVKFSDNINLSNNIRNYHSTNDITNNCKQQLEDYFSGKRTSFNLPLQAQGTKFQKQVWLALNNIPHGKTQSYADIAEFINNPKAVRAVGAANGKNSIAIITPCHRVIGKNGTLTGYAGGLDRKKWLLEHENNMTA